MSLVRSYSSFSLLLPVKIKLNVHYPVSKASKNLVKQAMSSQLPPCPASVSSISWINEAKQQRIKNATRVLLANQQTWLDYAQPEDSAASKGFPLNKQTNKQSTVFLSSLCICQQYVIYCYVPCGIKSHFEKHQSIYSEPNNCSSPYKERSNFSF